MSWYFVIKLIVSCFSCSKGKLICYYSDQRANTTHGQKMVHQVSKDLKSWGPVVDDVYEQLVPSKMHMFADLFSVPIPRIPTDQECQLLPR